MTQAQTPLTTKEATTLLRIMHAALASMLHAQPHHVAAYSWRERLAALDLAIDALAARDALSAEVARLEAENQQMELRVIEHCLSHWFTQGGKAQFGEIPYGTATNPDELIAEILQRVRERLAAVGLTPARFEQLLAEESR